MTPKSFGIIAGYWFTPLDRETYRAHCTRLREFGNELGLRGLVLLGPEGYNMTVCGDPEHLKQWIEQFATWGYREMTWKWAFADKLVFPRFRVKIKSEIVHLNRPGWTPTAKTSAHLDPADYHRLLQDPETIVLDTRNTYEANVGKFKRAIVPPIQYFWQFPEYLKKANLPKDKKILIYCTGGIRCEKAIVEMRQQGFSDVAQLNGGILNYFEALPREEVEKTWEGECFVFDHRVSVQTDLSPSARYDLCPHCGDPAETDVPCEACGTHQKLCAKCHTRHQTCSKACRDRVQQRIAREHRLKTRRAVLTSDPRPAQH
jgi:UPF0176 protein